MFVAVIMLKNQWVATHSWIFSDSALVAIAWISILVGKPFTMQYAKEQVVQDKWQHPIFLKINYILTAVWGLIFLISLGLHVVLIYHPSLNGGLSEISSYLPSVFGIWFCTWFPSWYRERCN